MPGNILVFLGCWGVLSSWSQLAVDGFYFGSGCRDFGTDVEVYL